MRLLTQISRCINQSVSFQVLLFYADPTCLPADVLINTRTREATSWFGPDKLSELWPPFQFPLINVVTGSGADSAYCRPPDLSIDLWHLTVLRIAPVYLGHALVGFPTCLPGSVGPPAAGSLSTALPVESWDRVSLLASGSFRY